VNLLPAECVVRQALLRRARFWLIAIGCAAGMAAAPVVATNARQRAADRLADSCRAIEKQRATARDRLSDLVADQVALRKRIVQADALRSKRSWSGLVGVLASCLPAEVWLTAVATDPAVPRGGSRPTNAEPNLRLDAPTRLRVSGFSVNYNHLYAFMLKLEQTRVFRSVDLVRSGLLPVLAGQAVRFELECAW
jgi:Tfp pilus assembly protein PilN